MGSKLAKLCVPESLRRRTLWSSVYRAMITLGGRTQYYDIEHISLPFEPERERYIRERGGLGEAALPGFYENIYTSVLNGVKIADAIQADETSRARDAIVRYVHEESADREDGGHDLYLLTAPMTRLLDSDYFRDGQISIAALARLGIRLSGTIRRITNSGYHLGVLDLDSLCTAKSETGTDIVTVTDLLYCREDGIHFPYPAIFPFNTPWQIRQGQPPAENTDVASLAMAFTAILNGTYGTPEPDTVTLPDYIPETVSSGFADARAGNRTAKDFQKLMDEMRNKAGNAAEVLIPIDRREAYSPPMEKVPEPEGNESEPPVPEEAEEPAVLYEEAVYDLVFTDTDADPGPDPPEERSLRERLRLLFRRKPEYTHISEPALTEDDTPVYIQNREDVPQLEETEAPDPPEAAYIPFEAGEVLDRDTDHESGNVIPKEEET